MIHKIADGKESLTKEYAESKKDTCELLNKINAFDGIKILLSLMEALDSESTKQLYNLEVKNLHNRAVSSGCIR